MDTNRRGFLGAIGRVTIGAAASVAGAAGASAATPAASEDGASDKPAHWGMVVDLRKCIGCQACTVACIMENAVPEDAFRTHVSVYELLSEGKDPAMVMLPRLCNHCDDPPCLPVCPVEATFKAENGEVLVDASKCVGCAYCVQACPYDARFINHETQVADKCTFCFHRTQAGLLPACVETCVGGARNFGDLNDPDSEVSRMLRENKVSVLRPEMHTNPNVYYIGLDEVLDGRVAGEAAYHPPLDAPHHAEGL